METTPVLPLLEDFAAAMHAAGIAAVPARLLADVVDAAREHGVSPVAIAVLVDPTEPDVARERAFSRVAIQLVGRSGADTRTERPLVAA
jgi:hypothetical protein